MFHSIFPKKKKIFFFIGSAPNELRNDEKQICLKNNVSPSRLYIEQSCTHEHDDI